MTKPASVSVTNHRGIGRRTLMRRLLAWEYGNVMTRTRGVLELLDQRAVSAFLPEARDLGRGLGLRHGTCVRP